MRDLYGWLLGRPDATDDDSFVALHGDSLSYVETSIRLEEMLGRLPTGWHLMPARELDALRPAPTRLRSPSPEDPRSPRGVGRRRTGGRWRSLETNVVLRAVAICLIVGTHADVFAIVGGAHVLIAVAGYNCARFLLTPVGRRARLAHLGRSIARVVVPSVVWISFAAAVAADYTWRNALLLHGVLGPDTWAPSWRYWFVEALVYTLVALALLMAIPWVDRLERRWAFWFPMGLAGLGLLTRYEVVVLQPGDTIHRAHVVFWIFALGWAAARAGRWWQRALVSAVVLATLPGFFLTPGRWVVVAAGVLLLVWLPSVRVPALLAPFLGVLASASLYVYLVHWQVYPPFEQSAPLVGMALALGAGVLAWRAAAGPVNRAMTWVSAVLARASHPPARAARPE